MPKQFIKKLGRRKLKLLQCARDRQYFLTNNLQLSKDSTCNILSVNQVIMADKATFTKKANIQEQSTSSQDINLTYDPSQDREKEEQECLLNDIQEVIPKVIVEPVHQLSTSSSDTTPVQSEVEDEQEGEQPPSPDAVIGLKRKRDSLYCTETMPKYIPTKVMRTASLPPTQLTLKDFLMEMAPVDPRMYTKAHAKYLKTKANKRFPKDVLLVIMKLLYWWGSRFQDMFSSQSLQMFINTAGPGSLYTTPFASGMKKRLEGWLKPFTIAGTPDTKTPVTKTQVYSPSVITPQTMQDYGTYTSSTAADGRSRPVVAQPYSIFQELLDGPDDLTAGIAWKKQTSSLFGSMSWRDIVSRYTLKSGANNGDLIVKLEVYKAQEVMAIDSAEWWKHAECRGMVAVPERSQGGRLTEMLRRALIEQLLTDPQHEAKSWPRRY